MQISDIKIHSRKDNEMDNGSQKKLKVKVSRSE